MISSNHTKGFIATTAVILLALSSIAFSLAVLGAAVTYADLVDKRVLRTQANMNAESCMDTIKLMLAKDYFLNGDISIKEFGCSANIVRNTNGSASVSAQVSFQAVNSIILEQTISRN